jgi:hypothetical protein
MLFVRIHPHTGGEGDRVRATGGRPCDRLDATHGGPGIAVSQEPHFRPGERQRRWRPGSGTPRQRRRRPGNAQPVAGPNACRATAASRSGVVTGVASEPGFGPSAAAPACW